MFLLNIQNINTHLQNNVNIFYLVFVKTKKGKKLILPYVYNSVKPENTVHYKQYSE